MSRKEITSLLNEQLIDKCLTRRNAYTYWAHEVPVRYNNKEVRVDFMEFLPYWYGANLTAAGVERGRFVCYEVKSCIDDIKSGSGLNFIGDENFIVCPIETYYEFIDKRFDDKKLRAIDTSHAGFLAFGAQKGKPKFLRVDNPSSFSCTQRKKSAGELLFCMIRALVANSCHSDVDHHIEGKHLGE